MASLAPLGLCFLLSPLILLWGVRALSGTHSPIFFSPLESRLELEDPSQDDLGNIGGSASLEELTASLEMKERDLQLAAEVGEALLAKYRTVASEVRHYPIFDHCLGSFYLVFLVVCSWILGMRSLLRRLRRGFCWKRRWNSSWLSGRT